VLLRLIDKYYDWKERRQCQQVQAIDWEALVQELEPLIQDHSMFLETRVDGFIRIDDYEDLVEKPDIVAIAVALVREGLEPWDTEQPALEMSETLSKHFGVPLPRLLSRQWEVFVGHYVRVAV
jgi:hypothetical protein